MSSLSSLTSSQRWRQNNKRLATVHRAASSGDIQTLRKVSLRDLNRKSMGDERRAIHVASIAGQLAALRLLVERGVKVNEPDANGNTPLHHAVNNAQSSCAVFLVFFGANLWSLNDQLETALAIALRQGNQDLVNFIDDTAARQFTEDPTRVAKLRRKAEYAVRQRLSKLEDSDSEETVASPRSTSPVDDSRSQWKLRTVPSMMASQLCSTLIMKPRGLTGNTTKSTSSDENNIGRSETDRTRMDEVDYVLSNVYAAQNHRKRLRYQRLLQRREPNLSTTTQSVQGRSLTLSQAAGLGTKVDRREATLPSTQSADDVSCLYSTVPDIATLSSTCSNNESQANLDTSTSPLKHFAPPEGFSFDARLSVTSPDGQSRDGNTSCSPRVRGELSDKLVEFLISLDLVDYRLLFINERIDIDYYRLLFINERIDIDYYRLLFINERIDIESIRLLNEADLIKLGLPLGPRRKLLNGVRHLDSASTEITHL